MAGGISHASVAHSQADSQPLWAPMHQSYPAPTSYAATSRAGMANPLANFNPSVPTVFPPVLARTATQATHARDATSFAGATGGGQPWDSSARTQFQTQPTAPPLPASYFGIPALPAVLPDSLTRSAVSGDMCHSGNVGNPLNVGSPASVLAHNSLYESPLPALPPRFINQIRRGESINFDLLFSALTTGLCSTQAYTISLSEDLNSDSQRPTFAIAPKQAVKVKIDSFISWLRTWNEYLTTAIIFRPHLTHQMLQYQATMTRFANTYARPAWVAYDAAFRQSLANNPTLRWDRINDELFNRHLRSAAVVTTRVGTMSTSPNFNSHCFNCRQIGHMSRNCPNRSNAGINNGTPSFLAPQRQRPRTCFAYNDGRPCGPNCHWPHRCSQCNGNHPRRECNSNNKQRS